MLRRLNMSLSGVDEEALKVFKIKAIENDSTFNKVMVSIIKKIGDGEVEITQFL